MYSRIRSIWINITELVELYTRIHIHTHTDWDCVILIVGVGVVCAWFRTAFLYTQQRHRTMFICENIYTIWYLFVYIWWVLPDFYHRYKFNPALDVCVCWLSFFIYFKCIYFAFFPFLYSQNYYFINNAMFWQIDFTEPPTERMMKKMRNSFEFVTAHPRIHKRGEMVSTYELRTSSFNLHLI